MACGRDQRYFNLKGRGMRIVASDYDGTLYSQGQLLGDVTGAVRRWREAGNLFGLATGRDFAMTAPEADKWQLPLDFYVCLNGSAIYDKDRQILHQTYLDDGLIAKLVRHPAAAASMHIQLSGAGPLRFVVREGSWFPGLGYPFTQVDEEEAAALKGLSQISVAYREQGESDKWEAILRRDFGSAIAPHRNKMCIDINAGGVDKAYGLSWLVRHMGWDKDRVHVVGDASNDLAMIRQFGGYTVPGATDEVAEAAVCTCMDVPDMLARLSG